MKPTPNTAGHRQPLAGLRVVEFTHMVMGPTVGLVLADLGAQVTKVEPLGGDKTRQLKGSGAGYFPMYNRNKRSISIDLKSPEGLEIAHRLIADADILVENFRPGALDKLGLDYDSIATRHPGVIYCSLKGFLSGPYEDRVALDEVTQMMGGLAYMTGPPRPSPAGGFFGERRYRWHVRRNWYPRRPARAGRDRARLPCHQFAVRNHRLFGRSAHGTAGGQR